MRNSIKTLILFVFTILFAGYLVSGNATRARMETISSHPDDATRFAAVEIPDYCRDAKENPLPLPSSIPPNGTTAFEKGVFDFLNNGGYLSWCRDKSVRDTGPYINDVYYGTHPAVRIYYSPKMMTWLTGDRKHPIPDGAMIIKEQYVPPSATYADMTEAQIKAAFVANGTDWTIMIKDVAGAKDGWYWGEFFAGMSFDTTSYPFNYPAAGFGQYCMRCHASAEDMLTFSALNNIKGFPGQPLSFRVDESWRKLPNAEPDEFVHPKPDLNVPPKPPASVNPEFLERFSAIAKVEYDAVQKMPPETLDHVVAEHNGPQQFMTSDQCMVCHSALNGPFGPVMFLQTAPPTGRVPHGVNVSPYGEWRWSPMGLAGRDPVFYAQLESEVALLRAEFKGQDPEKYVTATVNTCLTCHGAMGKRQFNIDHKDPYADFKLEYTQISDPANPNFKYGGLARDGISCTICHHIDQDKTPPGQSSIAYFLENSTTGQFQMSPPDELHGPFTDNTISPLPMKNSLGITPKYSAYTKDSRLCGSCHSINLPNVDDPLKPGEKPTVLGEADKNPAFKGFNHSIEQATYLEWLNSAYQDEFQPVKAQAQSCQQCHMSGSYVNPTFDLNANPIQQPIAIIEDQNFPAADHRAPADDIRVRFRTEGYARHELLGLNIPLLEMFSQFNDVLGVRKDDYMSGSKSDLADTIDNAVMQARQETVGVQVSKPVISNGKLTATVRVTNKTGHRFPSGVGFRRAFIEFNVIENRNGRENVVWASGRTNDLGLIVDGNGKVLPSEFFTDYIENGKTLQHYQPHYQTINSQDQVQIYEELAQDAAGKFTTSFIHRDHELKDNRLLPLGWTKSGPSPEVPHAYVEATYPKGNAAEDPQYLDGGGTDIVTYEVTLPAGVDPANVTVEATIFYQSIPPSFLNMRFQGAPDAPATRRLYYLTSNLATVLTPIRNWKLRLISQRSQ
jgi:mono/diheme cytochrome c family protein